MAQRIGDKGLTRQECLDVSAQLEAQGFIVYGPRVAIIRDPEAEKTTSGLYIPEEAKNKPLRGTIVMIGRGAEVDEDGAPMGLHVGDRITFSKYNNTLFDLPLVGGDTVYVEVVSVNNLYIGWRH